MVNCICDQILSENICRNINHSNYAWSRPASSTSKCDTQSGKIKFAQCRILHALHKLRKREQETPLLFKLTLWSRFALSLTIPTLSLSLSPLLPSHKLYICILVVFGLSALNSNQTNHIELCNKLTNEKCSHMSLQLRDSDMILCTNSQTLYTEGLERLRCKQV